MTFPNKVLLITRVRAFPQDNVRPCWDDWPSNLFLYSTSTRVSLERIGENTPRSTISLDLLSCIISWMRRNLSAIKSPSSFVFCDERGTHSIAHHAEKNTAAHDSACAPAASSEDHKSMKRFDNWFVLNISLSGALVATFTKISDTSTCGYIEAWYSWAYIGWQPRWETMHVVTTKRSQRSKPTLISYLRSYKCDSLRENVKHWRECDMVIAWNTQTHVTNLRKHFDCQNCGSVVIDTVLLQSTKLIW